LTVIETFQNEYDIFGLRVEGGMRLNDCPWSHWSVCYFLCSIWL